eukprot:TRINITY_DN6950_c0_g1_i1.p1 TRINITY_DN6950_c0_g1~~TRINITY_DN6950_c0_g1_i1.p1  ORF type:complete len:223 (+),score=75.64 TRINITY_DN6950_c0_g1_i1:196-864(+)
MCIRDSTNADEENQFANMMVLSWLAPVNNKSMFMFSINKRRHTATRLMEGTVFGLSVPTEEMRELVLQIGSNSGHGQKDKAAKLGVALCRSGWAPLDPERAMEGEESVNPFGALEEEEDDEEEEDGQDEPQPKKRKIELGPGEVVAVEAAVAHLVCTVVTKQEIAEEDDHWLVVARISDAYVRSSYWNGKTFCGNDAEKPSILTFFGSQTFGRMNFFEHGTN